MRGDCLRVKEIVDERHPSIYEDELAAKSRAMIRDFALRIFPAVDESNGNNRKTLAEIKAGGLVFS